VPLADVVTVTEIDSVINRRLYLSTCGGGDSSVAWTRQTPRRFPVDDYYYPGRLV